ncbi:MAG: hypothetical protein H7144_05205, partial [Burkholderiales bacterium]|nr:hypothetical protein [Phycisphaerae bacterium]
MHSDVRGEGKGSSDIHILHTNSGVRYGVLGDKPAGPAPTLLVFAGSIEHTLGEEPYCHAARLLHTDGVICVSLDLPCHGSDHKPDEPAELEGWRARVDAGDPLIAPFVKQASSVIDDLIRRGYSNPKRIAAMGTSRGGFAAMHL